MSDQITVLRSRGLLMAKRWLADETIEPYSRAKNFTHEQRTVEDIEALSDLLTQLENDPYACIVRGAPKPDQPQSIRRLLENFDDRPLHAICIEVDNYTPLLSNPLDGEDAAREFIDECLPAQFRDSRFHWQLSNSAGAPGKEGLFKGHIWFWLQTPYDSPTLRAWAKVHAPAVDRAVLQTVQVHYCAAPLFEEGVEDPVHKRSGFYRGGEDVVHLDINTEDLDIHLQGARQRGERLEMDDPQAEWLSSHWETWGTLANGGMLVSCPFEAEHSGGAKGDTSTVFFPAGTNGYTESSWVCLHTSCRDRSQGEFKQASGFLDQTFNALAQPPEPKVPSTHLNGKVIADPLILPPFQRNGSGKIETCLINVKAALESPRVSHLTIRYDTFKDALVCADVGTEQWRPFKDVDYTNLRYKMEEAGLKQVGREMIRDAVGMVAVDQAFDTAIDWVEGLTWDGVPRVETFWIDHFGVLDDASGYARACARYTWSALAGRAMSPGVQADMVPILSGKMGLRKSRGVLAMAPGAEFATKMSFHEPDVERARKMRGRLVVELDELQGLKGRDAEEILSWVTRSEEHWTPKFMEMTTTYRRRFIMIATTNEEDFLDNPNGERRWLPLAVGRQEGFRQVDTDRLAAVRNQLWAEGREIFLQGGVDWYEAERLARAQHGQWKADDGWRAAIVRWLDCPDMSSTTPRDRPHLTLLDVAEGGLGMPAKNMKWSDQRRIAKILKDEGYESEQRRVGGKPAKVWVPPDFC